jgi:hypothetical protein
VPVVAAGRGRRPDESGAGAEGDAPRHARRAPSTATSDPSPSTTTYAARAAAEYATDAGRAPTGTSATRVIRCASTTVTVPDARLVTKAVAPASSNATACAPAPNGTRPTTRSVAASTTLSVSGRAGAAVPSAGNTQRRRPSGEKARRDGAPGTGTEPTTFHVAASITATWPAAGVLTNRRLPSGLIAQSAPGLLSGTVVYSFVRPKPRNGSRTAMSGVRLRVRTK